MSAARDESRPEDTPADQRYDALIAQLRAVSPEVEALALELDDAVGDRLVNLQAEEQAQSADIERERNFYRKALDMVSAMATTAVHNN